MSSIHVVEYDLSGAIPEHRNFDSTDDCCVFIDDTFSQEVAEKLHGCSPSAKAFLSPQRTSQLPRPMSTNDVVPFGSDDEEPSTTVTSRSGAKSTASNKSRDFPFPPPPPAAPHTQESETATPSAGASSTKRRRFSTGRALMDMTNREDSIGRPSTRGASLPLLGTGSATCTTPKIQIVPSTSPQRGSSTGSTASSSCIITTGVTLAELHKVESQRDRYKKMYEHQKELAEKAMVLETENYDKLQAKIVEVVALQSRCEETKRFVRQLKKEILGVRQRELPVHNKIAEDCRLDVMVKEKFSKLLAQQRENFEEELAQTQDKLDSVENLLADVSTIACMRPDGAAATGDGDADCSPSAHDPVAALDKLRELEAEGKIPESVHFDVRKLDRLLTESYYESTALVNELRRCRRDLEKETDRRMDLETDMSRLRKKHQEIEVDLTNERRRMMISDERRAESHATLKSEVLTMREELVRAREQQQSNLRSGSRGRSLSSGTYSVASSSDDDCYRVHYNRSGSESCPRLGPNGAAFSAQGSKHAPSISPMVSAPTKA